MIVAYHGCDAAVAEQLLQGERFRKSRNDYDWLGEGVYFWEYGAARALEFAQSQARRGRLSRPAVVGAILQLGRCFDLMDTRFTSELVDAFLMLKVSRQIAGEPLPVNAGRTPDRLLRRRDCAVLNYYLRWLEENRAPYDTVRCGFVEGPPAFEGSGIHLQSHVQISVRNLACIMGVFRPRVPL
jgi:hypothetical protein